MGMLSQEQREFMASEWAQRMQVVEAENAERGLVPCQCMSGLPVTTVHGCDMCASEAEELYLARLLGMAVRNGRLVEDPFFGERDDPNWDYAAN